MKTTDHYRPLYHLTSPDGICDPFDPNGAIYWNGRYHLMYILQTEKGHCWGHLSSADLIHWQRHPHVLEAGGADKGIFSGGAFVDANGVATISYWGIDQSAQPVPVGVCLATSTDPNLEQWTKHPANPVIRETEFGITVTADGRICGASDPSAIWRHNGRYYLLTGSLQVLHKYGLHEQRPEHQGDTAYLFVSDDLVQWEYLHPFYQSDRKWTRADEDCMCPDFFPLGDRHVLLFISHNLGCQYYIGRYENDHFHPETHGRMTWVDRAYFAPESLVDPQGRRIMWAWLFDGRGHDLKKVRGWSGTMSLPRQLWLGPDRTLCMAPPEELAALRQNPRKPQKLGIAANTELALPEINGRSLEIQLDLKLGPAVRECGLKICQAPDGSEETVIAYDAVKNQLIIDTRRASLGDEAPKLMETAPFELAPHETLSLRVFLDQSVVEVYANQRQAAMRYLYPTRADSTGVSIFSHGDITAASVRAWDMAPLTVNPENQE